MKICLLSTSTPAHRSGGTETHSWNLAGRAAALGHKVTLITTSLGDAAPPEPPAGVEVHYLPGTDVSMSRAWMRRWKRASADKISELHSAEPQDIVWAEGFAGLGHAARSRERTGLPMISIVQGFGFRGDIASEWADVSSAAGLIRFLLLRQPRLLLSYLPWYRGIMTGSDAIVAVSDESAEELKKEFPSAAGKIRTIYNGVDTSLFSPSPEAGRTCRAGLGVSPDEAMVLMTGTATRQKGFHLGMKAFSLACAGRKARLVVAGDGPELADLKRLAEKLGISGKTTFLGPMPNDRLPPLYNAADIYLNPTLRAEGFGIVTAEAMACGKPSVVSLSGGTGSTIVDNESGFFVRPGDAGEMASRLARLLQDPPLREKFSAAARLRALESFDIGVMTDSYIKLSLRTLNGSERP